MYFKCRVRYISNVFQLVFTVSIFVAVYFSSRVFRHKLRNAGNRGLEKLEVIPKYPGEMGSPVHLPPRVPKKIEHLINRGWQIYKFNKFVSDLIPLNRSLPDIQNKWCKQAGRVRKHLPVTDIIICFHNEAWSTLLRTVHSVVNRTPHHLIGNIILVDDYSDRAHLKEPLQRYFSAFRKVKIVRALTRLGIIRARLLGMKHSTATVLTYLDSHCECMEGWLEPLLDRIARNPSTIVTPFIDAIDMETFQYLVTSLSEEKFIGGFNWNLDYTFISASTRGKMRHKDEMEPYDTPTIAGGLFSVDRNFFTHLGTYDWGFEFWGAENLELSFKTWMCGGRLEMVYCSRVGHVYRDETPHKFPSANEVMIKNFVRLAEVWMDDYAQIFYKSMGQQFNITTALSDVSDRKLLRKSLGCKSFKWYLDNVYPEKFIPVAAGAIVQIHTNLCLDADDEPGCVDILDCHDYGGSQFWMIGNFGEIRKDEVCLTAKDITPALTMCSEDSENNHLLFNYRTHQIINKRTQKCLTLSKNRSYVMMKKCQKRSWRQHWSLK